MRGSKGPSLPRAAVLLSPFDNLLWDRPFARRILGFDHLIEVYKPAPQVYARAEEKLKTQNIGFVSSNCWDALGAKSYGFTVYWINRSGAPFDRLGFQPDRVLSSLDEILQ